MAAAAAPAPSGIVRCPMPSSPHGPSGVSNAQGVIRPPPRNERGIVKPPRETDWICPPGHILLSVKDKTDRPLNDQGIPLSAKRQRRGDVPNLMANFFELSFTDVDRTKLDYNLQFFGVSHEGVTDFKAAKRYPDSAGRITAAVQGAVTIFCDHRHLVHAEPGDVLEYVPCDSGLRWTDGHSQFAPCIVQKYEGSARGEGGLEPGQDIFGEEEGGYGFGDESVFEPEKAKTPASVSLAELKKKLNEVNAAAKSKGAMATMRTQLFEMVQDDTSTVKEFQKLLDAIVFNPNECVDVDILIDELSKFACGLHKHFSTKPKDFTTDSVRESVSKYVKWVLNTTYNFDVTIVRTGEIWWFPKTSSQNSILNAMYFTILHDISKTYWNGDKFDENIEGDFYRVEKRKNKRLESSSTENAVFEYLKKAVDRESIAELEKYVRVFNNASVRDQWLFNDANPKVPLLGRFDSILAVHRNPAVNRLILSVVDGLACKEEDIPTDAGKHFKALVSSRDFRHVFNARCSELILMEPDMGTSPSQVTGYNFSDIHKTPVLSRDHEAAVLSARATIKAYTARTGKSPVIRHIPTKGFFVHEHPSSSVSSIHGSDKSRCFATLIEKGIGAYKNEIRVYLNPALRAAF